MMKIEKTIHPLKALMLFHVIYVTLIKSCHSYLYVAPHKKSLFTKKTFTTYDNVWICFVLFFHRKSPHHHEELYSSLSFNRGVTTDPSFHHVLLLLSPILWMQRHLTLCSMSFFLKLKSCTNFPQPTHKIPISFPQSN